MDVNDPINGCLEKSFITFTNEELVMVPLFLLLTRDKWHGKKPSKLLTIII